MNKLRDGKVGGFRVAEITTKGQDVEVSDGQGGLTKKTYTQFTFRLVHDARTNNESDFATSYDPSQPLKFTLRGFLDDRGKGVEHCPDRQKWSFLKWETVVRMLSLAGYQRGQKNAFPLPNIVYMKLALSGTENYINAIGGADLKDESDAACKVLDFAWDAAPVGDSNSSGLDSAL